MSRRQRRMIRRARGQAILRGVLLLATAAVLLTGVGSHFSGEGDFQARSVQQPTATPVASAFDETVTQREITLPENVWYAIQTGVYSSAEAAQSRADAYADRGAPGYVTHDSGKWRVLIACYGDKTDASAVQQRLSSVQQVETHLHAWQAPAVTLRLSGMAGQLDVAEAGLNLPGQAAVLLRDAAIALDAGESSVERARGTVESLGESITLWARTARERFPQPYPAMIASVLDFADVWMTQQTEAMRSGEAAALSAFIKKQAMAAYDRHVALRQALLNQ